MLIFIKAHYNNSDKNCIFANTINKNIHYKLYAKDSMD